MKAIIIAVLKLAASALWVCGFVTIAKDVNAQVVSGGSGGPSSMWDVFMQLGMFGIFQSIGALRGAYACWFGTMETELCTRHFNIWKNSSGNVVAAEEDHSAPFIGCQFDEHCFQSRFGRVDRFYLSLPEKSTYLIGRFNSVRKC